MAITLVVVGTMGTADAITWTATTSPGSGPATADGSAPSLAFNGSTVYAAYTDSSRNVVVRSSTNAGSSWTTQTSPGAAAGGGNPTPDISYAGGVLWVAFHDASNVLQVRSSTNGGSTWTSIASPFTGSASLMNPSISSDGELLSVAYGDGSNTVRVRRWDGTTWTSLASPGSSSGGLPYASVATAGDRTFVAYNSNNATVVRSYSRLTGSWTTIPLTGGVGANGSFNTTPGVAWDGQNLWLTWNTNGTPVGLAYWDGATWSTVTSPGSVPSTSFLANAVPSWDAANRLVYVTYSGTAQAATVVRAAAPPGAQFANDTNASAGGANPTNLTSATPHISRTNTTGTAATRQRSQVATDGLDGVVGLWHLDGDYADATNIGGDFQASSGTPEFVTGRSNFGQGLRMNPGDTIRTPITPALHTPTVTVEAWFRATALGGNSYIIDNRYGTTSRIAGIYFDTSLNNIRGTWSSGGTTMAVGASAAPYLDDHWHYAAFVRTSGSQVLYLDGVAVASAASVSPVDVDLQARVQVTPSPLMGAPMYVDDLRVSNVARTAGEIAGYYRAALPHFTTLWDQDPTNAGAAVTCAIGARCPDSVFGTGGTTSQQLQGGRYYARQKLGDASTWSPWSPWDWFEQPTGASRLLLTDATNANAAGLRSNASVRGAAPHFSWTNGSGQTINRQRVQVHTTPLDDVRGLWHMDTAPGTTVDSSGSGNAITWTGTPGTTAGPTGFGQAMTFNGTSQYGTVSNAAFAKGNDFAVEAWFRTSNGGAYGTLFQRNTASCDSDCNFGLFFDGSGQRIVASASRSGTEYDAYSTGPVNDNQWHQAVMVVSASNLISLYVDGALHSTVQAAGPFDTSSGVTRIGASDTAATAFYAGAIDEVRYVGHGLSATQVRGAYLTGRPNYTLMWDSDSTAAGTNVLASCNDLTRCADITYGSTGSPTLLAQNGAVYYARAQFKASASSFWSNWSDADWFVSAEPAAPTAQQTHDTNAQSGSTNPTNIGGQSPHFSFVNSATQAFDRQRVQVLTDPLDDVEALWHFDTATGTMIDASGNGHTLAPTGTPTFTAGKLDFAEAATFNGTNQHAAAAVSTAFDLPNDFTVDAWFRTNDISNAAYPTIVSKVSGSNTQNFGIDFSRSSGDLEFEVTRGSGIYGSVQTAGAAYLDNQWHHAALTVDASNNLRGYVDGVQVGSTVALGGTVDMPSTPVAIGNQAGDPVNFFRGRVDDVRIVRRALSAAELLGYVRTQRPHNALLWDSDPAQAGTTTMASCAAAARCGDAVYGATGTAALPLLGNGARYWVRARMQRAGDAYWSAWSTPDWFAESQSLTISTSGTSDLGTFTAGSDATATGTVTVTTNNPTGYTLSATDASDTTSLTSGGNSVADYAAPCTAPTPWAGGTVGGFGITVLGVSGGASARLAKWGTGTGTSVTDFTNNSWCGLRSTTSLLHQRTATFVGPDVVTLGVRMNIGPAQAAGAYTESVSLTALANP